VTLSPLISLSLIDLFKGLPMCYPRLPVGPGLLTGVGVGSSKSSSLDFQVQLFCCLCLSFCKPDEKSRKKVRGGGGSRQIIVGQSYTLVFAGYSLIILVDAKHCYFSSLVCLCLCVSLTSQSLSISLNKIPHRFCSA
jgi:hypothetical protein